MVKSTHNPRDLSERMDIQKTEFGKLFVFENGQQLLLFIDRQKECLQMVTAANGIIANTAVELKGASTPEAKEFGLNFLMEQFGEEHARGITKALVDSINEHTPELGLLAQAKQILRGKELPLAKLARFESGKEAFLLREEHQDKPCVTVIYNGGKAHVSFSSEAKRDKAFTEEARLLGEMSQTLSEMFGAEAPSARRPKGP